MTGVLDEFPLNFSRPQLRALRDLLSRVIFQPRDVQAVVLDAGLNPGMIDFSGNASLQWYSIMTEARAEERLAELLAAVRRWQPPLGTRIDELVGEHPVLEPGTGPTDDLTRPQGAGWKGFGAERLVVSGVDTLLGIAFLSAGLDRSRSICRITSTFNGRQSWGTASLIGTDLLLTNHHVLHDWDGDGRAAQVVEAWFDYELDEAGRTRSVSVVPCDPRTIAGDREHDWSVIRTSAPPPPTSAVLDLTAGSPPRENDYVFIIQHPDGGPKMIGLSHNLVRHVDNDVIQYWTDTKAGSSGAPVFDSRWRVVGLHHRWVEAPEGEGIAYRNQGRRIERVLAGMGSRGIEWASM
ncbi:trypsin-like peptidase domain-containing protein [Streptomyces olivaceiscleroticus]|uniref:Effector-associated domain-containing protein n=1 Tax=Streptomyces olivaceiscleroticus TaxID=68245 RepID=A0ABN0ZKV5_9ACTN